MATSSVAAAASTKPPVLAHKKPSKEAQDGKSATHTSLYEEYERLSKDIQNIHLKTMICKTETHQLMKEESAAKQEVKRIQAVPLVLGNFVEAVDSVRGIVSGTSGSQYFVRILSTLNKEQLKPNVSVGLHKSSNACVLLLPSETDATITLLN